MNDSTADQRRRVLLTGATGYVGGRLLPLLETLRVSVRCIARRPEYLRPRVANSTEVVGGDVLDSASLTAALDVVDTAYYLVHSMGSRGEFESQDRTAAKNFASAARRAGVRRIIYLGGLGDDDQTLSAHLRSRHEVGDILRNSGCQVIEFRASIVIGSGSLSYELVRALVERLPIMICPRWVSTKAQPIAIEDLLQYLLAALDWQPTENRVFEIGGPDQVTYGEIMQEYARQRGLRRWLISVPLLTPRLSSLWLGLVTPVYSRIGRNWSKACATRRSSGINRRCGRSIFCRAGWRPRSPGRGRTRIAKSLKPAGRTHFPTPTVIAIGDPCGSAAASSIRDHPKFR